MGEIADALKKANAEREARERKPAAPPKVEPRPPARPAAAPVESASPVQSETTVPTESTTPDIQRFDALQPESAPDIGTPEIAGPAETPQVADDEDLAHLEHLALRIRQGIESRGLQGVAICSALRDEGKTTVACHVARAVANISPGQRIALIDLDLRNPSVAQTLRIKPSCGIDVVLAGQANLGDACVALSNPPLDVYPVLQPRRSAHELLAGARFEATMAQLARQYATFIVDTPPALLVPDAALILRRQIACATVARVGRSRVRRIREMVEMLPPEQYLGSIVNCAAVPKHQKGYAYYYGPEEEAPAS